MSELIRKPFDLYPDLEGDPLDDGYIYVGQANANPEISPIELFWDVDRTIPAAQPLRTNEGLIYNNGRPGRVYCAEPDYSITVKTKKKQLVYSSLSNTGLSLASSTPALVANFATLRLIDPVNEGRLQLKAHTNEGDGGFGFFRGVTGAAPGTYVDDDGIIVVPTGGDGSAAHLREFDGDIKAGWYGPVGGDTGDQSGQLIKAVNAAGNLGIGCDLGKEIYRITSPIPILGSPTYAKRGRSAIYGSGDGSEIHAIGCACFTMPDQGYYGFTIRNLRLNGNNTGATPAIDMSPSSTAYVVAGSIFENLRILNFVTAFKMKNAQINEFRDLNIDFTAAGKVFEVVPDSGSGQQCNSNRIQRMRVTGDGTMMSVTLPTVSERATYWSFTQCDIQFSGSQIPFYIIDSGYVIEDSEFENSTATYLIHLESTGASLTPSYCRINNNVLTGGASATKVKITKTGTQRPTRNWLENNDGGTGAWLDDGGVSTVAINNNGTITDTAGTSYFRMYMKNGVLELVNGNASSNKGGLKADGISGGSTPGKNVAGSVTFATLGTAPVVFDGTRQEADANYRVVVTGTANETFWVPTASKLTSGFTVYSSNATSTATVDWHILRGP